MEVINVDGPITIYVCFTVDCEGSSARPMLASIETRL